MKLPVISSFLSSRGRFAAAVVVVALLGGGWIWWSRSSTSPQTLLIERKDLVQQVAVSGKVVPGTQVDLGFSQSGRIAGVYAQAGGTVVAGALLVQIENGDLRASVMQKEAALAQERAKLDSLQEGTRPESLAVSQAAVASAQSALEQADQALGNAIADAYRAGDDAVHNKIDTFLNAPRSASPSVVFPVSDQNMANALLKGRISAESMLASWGSEVGVLDAAQVSASAAHARANLASVATLLADANAVLNHAITTTQYPQSDIDTYTASVAAARTSVNTAAAALTTALSAQRAAAAALASAQKSLALAQAPATSSDLAAQQARVDAAAADVASTRAALGKTLITAPFSGIVTRMDAKAGEIVSPSDLKISMMSAGAFQIETYVPEVSIARIKRGDMASTTLDAYGPDVSFDAIVVSVDPAETIRDGVSTYKVILQFVKRDERIRSSMPADLRIVTARRESAIAVPEGAVEHRGGEAYVRVLGAQEKTEEKESERKVETGERFSGGEVEILSGLSEGETVMLP